MSFSDAVTTVTREQIMPSVNDTILKGTPGLLRVLGNSRPWKSGYRFDVPIKFKKSTAGGIVEVGGTLSTARQDTRIKMQFEPQRIHKPVVADDIEISVNDGDEKIVDFLETEYQSIAQDLTDDLAGYLYTGTGATGTSFDSILNAADDSTNYGTYGGQSRTTYTSIKGYYTSSVGALGLSDLATAYDEVQIGIEKPSVMLTTPTIWTAYEGLLQPTVRAGYQMGGYPQVTREGKVPSQTALRGDIGFDSVFFRGTPIVADEKCTSEKLFMVNERHFFWAGLDLKGYQKINTKKGPINGPQAMPIPKGFNHSGLIRSINQPAEVAHLYMVGNFISDNPRMTGQLTGITG